MTCHFEQGMNSSSWKAMPMPDVENLYGIVFVRCDDPAHACRCGDLLALLRKRTVRVTSPIILVRLIDTTE